MGVIWSDTHPRIEQMLLDAYDRMSADELLGQVTQLTQAAQQMALAGLRDQFPDATEREIQMRLASLWYGPELVRRATGWSPWGQTPSR